MAMGLQFSDGELVLKLLLLLNLAATVVASWKSLIGKPAKTDIGPMPLEVRGATRWATHEEHLGLSNRVDRLESTMRAAIADASASGEQRMQRIENKLNATESALRNDIKEVLRAVSRLEGKQL